MFDPKLKEALGRVQKPGRYTGGEPGSVYKDKEKVDVRFAFCFPDTYEVGMSFLGEKILYELLTACHGDAAAGRHQHHTGGNGHSAQHMEHDCRIHAGVFQQAAVDHIQRALKDLLCGLKLQLRQGIALRGYGQKDPVVEYRIEGFDMFDQMVDSIREDSVKMLLTIEIRQAGAAPKREQVAKPTGEGFVPGNGAPGVKGAPKGQPVRVIKIGRNDPCPCGSGLKWKKCTCKEYHPDL